jgi:hypothetical protein
MKLICTFPVTTGGGIERNIYIFVITNKGNRLFFPDHLWGSQASKGVFHFAYSSQGVHLTTPLYLMQRLRMYAAVCPFHHMPVWHAQEQQLLLSLCMDLHRTLLPTQRSGIHQDIKHA